MLFDAMVGFVWLLERWLLHRLSTSWIGLDGGFVSGRKDHHHKKMERLDIKTYKQLKEEFVSDLLGTTMLEIATLSALFPAYVLLRQWGQIMLRTKATPKQENDTSVEFWRNLWMVVVDYLFVVIPTLATITLFADQIYVLAALVFTTLISLFFSVRSESSTISVEVDRLEVGGRSFMQSISSYRFIVMLVTCISILAVDFNVFPRRYAKTETYGTGLMDVGVGSFVIANAIVSKEARNLQPMKQTNVIRKILPLLLLGSARLVFTTGVDYQVHVGEYGVHWNFFFTLAGVTLLTSLIRIPAHRCGIVGFLILLVYQLLLLGGLNSYLNSTERGANFFSQNKEGIVSLVGYWSLYLLGVQVGYHIFEHGKSLNMKNIGSGSATQIWVLALSFWVLAIFSDCYVERVSRRTCNLAYVMFVLAVNLEGLGIAVFSDFVPGAERLVLEKIFSENMLVTFLLANVLTGIVNLSIDTIFASMGVAYVALALYLVVLVGAASVLKATDIKIKL